MQKFRHGETRLFAPIDFCPIQGKPCYDKKGAITAKNARMKNDHMKLREYHCDDCNCWHLSKSL